MRKPLCGLALAALLSGCAAAAALALSEEARQDLVTNFEASVEAQQLLAEHVFAISRGDVDISGYTYVPPSGDQPGTLSIDDGTFPFGTGSLLLNFTAEGDTGPIDPFAPGVDLSTHSNVTIVADFVFDGVSDLGKAMRAGGDFTATTMQNGADSVTTMVDGVFDVHHDGYDVDFTATDVEMVFDLAADTVTSVTGRVDGTLDIPNFFYDADFTVDGLGSQLQIGIDAVVEQIDYLVDLSQL